MRRLLIVGNWKMNLDRQASLALAKGLVERLVMPTDMDIAICPPAVYLDAVGSVVNQTPVQLGAQDMYCESNGAFTGEISASMLVDLGCRYVILGHSERRHVLGESDPQINSKVLAALAAGLIPIVCVGETLDEREAGTTVEVVRRQFDGSMAGLTTYQISRTVLAYEPVWAIGTGRVATPEQAQDVHADLRMMIEKRYNTDVASVVPIQYGGSVKPENAAALLSQPDIDGALVGGASLQAEAFLGIVAESKEEKV